jgi:hypothetical protein
VALACALAIGAATILLARRESPRACLALAVLAACAVPYAARRPSPALASPPLANPALQVRAFRDDRDFAVAVVDDGVIGERTLLTDGFRAAGTGRDYRYMQVLGHLPVLLHPAPDRVAVLALGTGTTLGAVSLHEECARIDVLEISRAVVAAAPFFAEKNHGALDRSSERVVVRAGDGRRTLASESNAYDVITMEPLLPDSPFAVYLYTREFYAVARRALRPGGILCQWVPPHALEPATFDAVLDAFASANPWSGVWVHGTQVILIGADAEPAFSAARFPGATTALGRDLGALGLGSPADVIARYCGSAGALRGTTRALSDADPWIVHRARRRGAELLLDLPTNLARLRALDPQASARWTNAAGSTAADRRAGIAALRVAREVHAIGEATLRGARRVLGPDATLEESLVLARAHAGDDPEVRAFEDEIAFLDALRRGVALLATEQSKAVAQAALEPLVRAAEKRPERGDVHLYVSIALELVGSAAAEKAFTRALESCPRIALTNEGRRAQRLGLSSERWQRACAAAEAALAAPARL